MNFVLTFFTILLTYQTTIGKSFNITQSLVDYFVEVENVFCPLKSRTCGSNTNNSNDDNYFVTPSYLETDVKCCGQCSCYENTCDVIDSCCVETLGRLNQREESKILTTCENPQLKTFVESGLYPNAGFQYEMITKCPDMNDEGNIDLVNRCEQSELFEDISTKIPVTDATTMFIYKNQYCAHCHNASERALHHWDANIQCIQSIMRPKSIGTAVKEVLESEACNLIYLYPESLEYDGRHDCRMIISSCNVTGLWKTYDPNIEAGCEAYKTIFNFRYRNVFCYLCNSNATDNPIICEQPLDPTVYVDFSAILKGQAEVNPIATKHPGKQCSTNQIYDPIKRICRMMECLFPKSMEKGTCVNLLEQLGGITYGIFVRFTPNKHIQTSNTSDAEVISLSLQLLNILYYWLDTITFTPYRSLYIYAKYRPVNARIEKTVNYFVAYVEIDLDLLFSVSIDIIEHMLTIPEYLNLSDLYYLHNNTELSYKVEIDLYNVNYTADIGVQEIRDEDNESLSLLLFDKGFTLYYPKTILSKHYSCPLVRMNNKEYNITRHNRNVFIKELGVLLGAKDVLILNDDHKLDGFSALMCVDMFKEFSSIFINTVSDESKNVCKSGTDSVTALLSIICSSISISFSVFTVIVYFSFKELKTQPGINNIILCLTLIVAQTLFQFGSGQSCNVSKAVCQGIGVLVHFSWLFLIFWMNCSCIHMFRVFRLGRIRIVAFNKLKTTFMYIIYSLSASLAIILITVIVSLTKSNGTEIGYGDTLCYIQGVQLIAFSFTLPVGIVVLINIILFLVVILQIKKTGIKSKDDRNFLHIYVKLSTLTGFTWIFGILSFLFNIDVFDYIFIVLNASQGMFLFFAFVANRQTFHFLLKRKSSQTSNSLKSM